MPTAKPPVRYGAIGGARPGGFALPSYTITRDTTSSGPDPLLQKVVQTGVTLRIDPNPRLIVFGFDAGQRDGRWKAYLENITQDEPDLNVYAAGNPETATGAFRPPRPKRVKKVTSELSS